MFEEIARTIAGLAFGLVVLGIVLTIVTRWKNGEEATAKTPIYMGLHYLRFLSWILLGCVLGGLWPYIAGRIVALGLIPVVWLQAKTARPELHKVLVWSGTSLTLAFGLGVWVYSSREFLTDQIYLFELAVALSFVPQVFYGNPNQILRYIRGPLNGESMTLHILVASNAAAWALFGVASGQTWIWLCYGVVLFQELVMIGVLRYSR